MFIHKNAIGDNDLISVRFGPLCGLTRISREVRDVLAPVFAAIRLTVRFLRRHEHGRGQAPSFGGVAETFDARNRGAQVQAMDI